MMAAAAVLLILTATTVALGAAQQCNSHGFYCTDATHFQECPGEGLPPSGAVNDCGPLFCSMDCELMCMQTVPCSPPTTTTTEPPTTTTTMEPLTTTTTEVPTTTVAPYPCEAQGSFADPDDCRRFYSCVPRDGGGYWALNLVCPQGSLFDAAEGRCSVNATCQGGAGGGGCNEYGFRCVDATHGQLCPDDGLPPQGQVFSCPQGAGCRDGCPYLCWSEADACPTQPPPTSPPPEYACEEAGKFADPDDCAAFFVCVLLGDGSFALLHPSCPAGSGFDAASGLCSAAAPCALCNDHGFRCVDATHVQLCDGAAPSGAVVACPAGTSCRPECALECWADGDVCPTEPPPTAPPTEPPPESGCEAEGRFPDPEDCTRFYVCAAPTGAAPGTLSRVDFDCPQGSGYDRETQRCAPDAPCGGACNPQGFYCVDATRVRLCEEGAAYPAPGAATVLCPAGTSCDMDCRYQCWGGDDAAGAAQCPSPFICEAAGRFPAPHNCSFFYLCSSYNGGFLQLQVPCPEGSHYDAANSKCTEGACIVY